MPEPHSTRYVRNEDGSWSVWTSHDDGETWQERERLERPEDDDENVPVKSETWFTESGAVTVDHWEDGEVTVE